MICEWEQEVRRLVGVTGDDEHPVDRFQMRAPLEMAVRRDYANSYLCWFEGIPPKKFAEAYQRGDGIFYVD
jgi:hypothetical protein